MVYEVPLWVQFGSQVVILENLGDLVLKKSLGKALVCSPVSEWVKNLVGPAGELDLSGMAGLTGEKGALKFGVHAGKFGCGTWAGSCDFDFLESPVC